MRHAPRLLKRLSKYEALIIDDIGYVEQSREEMEVLFVLLAQRYERGSVMLTSILPFSQWERIFKNPILSQFIAGRCRFRQGGCSGSCGRSLTDRIVA